MYEANHMQQQERKEKPEKEAERSCIGCGQKRPKGSLRRVVLDEQGHPTLDAPQKAPGRGAYLCGKGCLKAAAVRKAFQRAFRGKANALELTKLEFLLQPGPSGGNIR